MQVCWAVWACWSLQQDCMLSRPYLRTLRMPILSGVCLYAGAGFGLFQTPNNSTIISAAPANRSGGASGMIGTARLLGQTLGATLVALLFNLTNAQPHTFASLFVGIGFAAVAAVVSCLRLSQQMPLKRREP